ncbi:sensor histidine kinase [Fusibacter sp. JL216-2]|uniref:sensor histidine kinase n=1 Tax=Fusibacter sp. JL216-2 TaxID=3071453 RepID=UPI003D332F1F
MDKRLLRQLEIERVIANIANQFIMFEDLSEAIDSALSKIGMASRSSRAYVFEFDMEKETMSNTYEWCGQGVTPEIDNLQDLPVSLFPWWIEKISTGKVLNIYDVDRLGPEARAEKEILQAQGIKSVLVLPIYYDGVLHGFVGLDDCLHTSKWMEEDEVLLGLAADIFSNAFDRLKTDIELKQTNDELSSALRDIQRYQMRLIQQEQMAAVGQLAAGVAHEINNPLGFVMSNFQVLKDYVDKLIGFADSPSSLSESDADTFNYIKEDIDDMMDDFESGFERIKKIVMGLKSFSMVDSQVEIGEYDFSLGLEHTLTLLHNRIKQKANVVVNVPKDLPTIECDGRKMNQVLLNLITNALDAIEQRGKDRGTIEINACIKHQALHFDISDNGIGIPEEYQSKIYQPFFTTKPVGEGTGNGLSIVYDTVVSVHRGSIAFESKYGQGTKFRFEIPVKNRLEKNADA